MAVTQLSDLITPVIYPLMDKQSTIRTTRISAVYESGLVRADNEMSKKIAGGGETFNIPFYNDLDRTESNIASDDPTSSATPAKITAGKDIARRQYRTMGWSSARLNAALTNNDPMKAIKELVGQYWADDLDKMAINTLDGIIADNVANDSGDMVKDIATDSASAITDAELISANAIIDARQTMGDASDIGCVMIMHSVCATKLRKLNLIDYIPNSEGKIMFQTYLGDKVWISDQATAVAGTNRITYNTYIAKPGLMIHGTAPAERPVEVDSFPAKADGAGVEELWMRKQLGLHVPGIKWTEASVSGAFPTNAELAAAANWDRVYSERKQIPLVCLKTNG